MFRYVLSPKSRSEFNRKLTITGNGLFSSISVFCDFSCTSWFRTYLPKSTAKYLHRFVLMGFGLALMPYEIFKIVSFLRLICNPHPIVQIEIPSREWTYWKCVCVHGISVWFPFNFNKFLFNHTNETDRKVSEQQ